MNWPCRLRLKCTYFSGSIFESLVHTGISRLCYKPTFVTVKFSLRIFYNKPCNFTNKLKINVTLTYKFPRVSTNEFKITIGKKEVTI